MMSGPRRALVTGAACCFALTGIASADTGTTASLDRSTGEPGTSVEVSGSGWPPGARLQVSLCGNKALRGSVDCDLPGSRSVVTSGLGTFELALTVAAPPAPCPCVVYVLAEGTTTTVRLPFDVVTAPSSASTEVPTALPARAFEVEDVHLAGSGPWTSWFGLQPERDLVLTITNVGGETSTPQLEMTVGRGDRPTGALDAPTLDELQPGETATYRVPIELDILSVGSFTVVGEIAGSFGPTEFRASTSVYPWGLIAAALVILQLLLLRLRDRLRRRLRRATVEIDLAPIGRGTGVAGVPGAVDPHGEQATEYRLAPEPGLVQTTMPSQRDLGGAEERPVEPEPSLEIAGAIAPSNVLVLDLRGAEPPAMRRSAAAERARQEAERALERAAAEADEVVAAAMSHLHAVEADHERRLAEIEAEHETSLEVLDAVWRRAEELAGMADLSLSKRREAIERERSDARRALLEAEAARGRSMRRAREELAQAVRRAEDDQAAMRAGALPASRNGDEPQRPEVDELDKRLARAVHRALASMGPDSVN